MATERFSLDTSGYEATGRSTVMDGGRPAGRVMGCKVEAEFDAGAAGTVLFVSADSTFVGVLHILLVREGRVAGRVTLGDAGAEGLASEFEPLGPGRVRFRFPFRGVRELRVERRTGWLGLRARWLHLV